MENLDTINESAQTEEKELPTDIEAEIPAEAEAEPAEATDYRALELADIEELKSTFGELREIQSITELKNPLRYGALRDLGLTATEAYLASEGPRRRTAYNNRSHLSSAVPAESYGSYIGMTRAELDGAKQIFGDLSDAEIQRLYKKVTR